MIFTPIGSLYFTVKNKQHAVEMRKNSVRSVSVSTIKNTALINDNGVRIAEIIQTDLPQLFLKQRSIMIEITETAAILTAKTEMLTSRKMYPNRDEIKRPNG